MATPRVFVSSTCYDLSEIRDSLDGFIRSYNFIPVMSDKGDVYYNPDLHTHDACLKEVESCQLFILIIGGRFGGEYYKDKKEELDKLKSITNLEYRIAKQCKIPIFTFVKRNVLENHLLYKDNKKHNPEAKSVYYSAIDKQKYAGLIFEFIDEVRLSLDNNAFFSFDYSKEIQEMLAKQWAGMIYDFLIERQRQNEIMTTNKLIENLTIASQKTEELIKKIISRDLGESAKEVFDKVDNVADAKKFFKNVFSYFKLETPSIVKIVSELSTASTQKTWYEYLDQSSVFKFSDSIKDARTKTKHELVLESEDTSRLIVIKSDVISDYYKQWISIFENLYLAILKLDEESYKKVLESLI